MKRPRLQGRGLKAFGLATLVALGFFRKSPSLLRKTRPPSWLHSWLPILMLLQ